MKETITRNILSLDLYSLEMPINNIIYLLNDYNKIYRQEGETLSLKLVYDSGDDPGSLFLVGERLETDDEYKTRLSQEKANRKKEKDDKIAKDRALFETLKKRFEK